MGSALGIEVVTRGLPDQVHHVRRGRIRDQRDIQRLRTVGKGLPCRGSSCERADDRFPVGELATSGTTLIGYSARPAGDGDGSSPRFTAWGERLWRHPFRYGVPTLLVLVALTAPVIGLRTAIPSITVVPEGNSSRVGYEAVQKAFGEGAPGTLQIITPSADAARVARRIADNSGIAAVMSATHATDDSGLAMIQAVPLADPSDPALADTVHTLRNGLPDKTLVGGAAVENLDLQQTLNRGACSASSAS